MERINNKRTKTYRSSRPVSRRSSSRTNSRLTKSNPKKYITCGQPLIEIIRANIIESIHSGHLLILDASGNIKLGLGKSDFIMYPRSAIKAIQASAMVRNGLGTKILDDELISLVCSSHIGSLEHQTNVKRILATVGLDETALQNTPFTAMLSNDVNEAPTSLAAPCSGKHAGMITTSKLNNWDIKTYKDPKHPVQVACRKEIQMLSNEKITKIAVDGCGAPLFGITLRGLAQAFHNLMISQDPVHQRVVNACRAFPIMVSGTGTLPTVAMESVPGLFVKTGAEAVLVAGLPRGETIVWKMSDGVDRGEGDLLKASLKYIGVDMPRFNISRDRDSSIRATI